MGEVTITGLSKAYGGVPVLNSVDLNIHGGEFFTLLGTERLRQDHAAAFDRGFPDTRCRYHRL